MLRLCYFISYLFAYAGDSLATLHCDFHAGLRFPGPSVAAGQPWLSPITAANCEKFQWNMGIDRSCPLSKYIAFNRLSSSRKALCLIPKKAVVKLVCNDLAALINVQWDRTCVPSSQAGSLPFLFTVRLCIGAEFWNVWWCWSSYSPITNGYCRDYSEASFSTSILTDNRNLYLIVNAPKHGCTQIAVINL